ncbi:MAG: hypothetical protein RIB84_13070 [Sneathiellaceae bacterium]
MPLKAAGFDPFRLVRLVGGHRNGGIVCVFTCYLDDSNAEGAAVYVLAGYVAPIDAWERYETQSEKVYQNYGVNVLDSKLLNATRGPYKGWSKVKKRSFVQELMEIAAPELSFGLSVAIQKSTFKEFKKSHKKISSMSPYGAIFGFLITVLYSDRIPNKFLNEIRRKGVSFVVESGNKNNSNISDCFSSMKDSPLYGDSIRSLTFLGKKDCRAIHLADYNAFHSRKFQNAVSRLGDKMDVLISHEYMDAIQRVPHRFDLMRGVPSVRSETSEIIFSHLKGDWIGPLRP